MFCLQSVPALHIASKEGQCKAVVELLCRGADVCLKDHQVRSSIAFAHAVVLLYIFLKLCMIVAPVLLCDGIVSYPSHALNVQCSMQVCSSAISLTLY